LNCIDVNQVRETETGKVRKTGRDPPGLTTHHDCIKNQLNFTAHGVSFMETQRPRSTQTRQPASEQPATFNIQHAAGATITESNDEKMMKTSKVAKHEMATKIIFSQALGVCAELRT